MVAEGAEAARLADEHIPGSAAGVDDGLDVVDKFSREALAIGVGRRLNSADVIETLAELTLERGTPAHIRSDNGPEFVAKAARESIAAVGASTAYIEPESPWENGYVESFNSKVTGRSGPPCLLPF